MTADQDEDEELTAEERADLEGYYWSIEDLPGHRIEIIEGNIIIRPLAFEWEIAVENWLTHSFAAVCEANGWQQHSWACLRLTATGDITMPDHSVAADLDHVLLVSEVVSTESERADRETKPASYARDGIPQYLLIDLLADPPAATLFTEPGPDGYTSRSSIPAGPDGATLRLPAPLDVTLDLATMPAVDVSAEEPELTGPGDSLSPVDDT